MDRETLGKLNSPLDITMLKSFADRNEHHLGEPVWEIMRMIGSDLVDFITSIRSRLDIVSKYTEVWEEINEDNRFKVLFLPRVDDLPEDASGVLGYQVKALGLEEEIISVISPDSRGRVTECVGTMMIREWILAGLKMSQMCILLIPGGLSQRLLLRK